MPGSGLTISTDTIERAIQGLGGIDLSAAWTALKSGDVDQELQLGAEAADVIACFWPEAKYVEDVLELMIFVDALRKAGLWRPGEPADPAMQHAAGNTGQGTPTMHAGPTIAPGGTPSDPYGFEAKFRSSAGYQPDTKGDPLTSPSTTGSAAQRNRHT